MATLESNYRVSVNKKSSRCAVLLPCVCLRSDLLERLLEAGLFGHRQGAHRVPAVAELLQLNLDPGSVVATRLHQIPGRTLQSLNAAGSLS